MYVYVCVSVGIQQCGKKKRDSQAGAYGSNKWNFLSSFYKTSNLCPVDGSLLLFLYSYMETDRQKTHKDTHAQRHLQFLSISKPPNTHTHTQALTVQQSIFSEGWPPWRTSRQSEGAPAMKGPVIAFDRSPSQRCRTSNANR